MRQSQSWISLSLVLLAACTGNVNLGGPRDDAGQDSAPEPLQDGGADTSSPLQDAGIDAPAIDAGPSAALDQAEGYANGNASCTVDSDCCVVFDGCVNRGLVVGVGDKDKVASLLSEYDQYEGTIGTASVCTGCIPPPVQVTCVNNKCIGTEIPFTQPDGGTVDPSLWQNHCGRKLNVPASSHTGSIFGC